MLINKGWFFLSAMLFAMIIGCKYSPYEGNYLMIRGNIIVDNHEGSGYNWNGLKYYVKILDASTVDGTTPLESYDDTSGRSTLTDAGVALGEAPPLFVTIGVNGIPPAGEIASIFVLKDIPEGVYDIHIFVDKNDNAFESGKSYPIPDYTVYGTGNCKNTYNCLYIDKQYVFNDVEVNELNRFIIMNLTTSAGIKKTTSETGITAGYPGYWGDDTETISDPFNRDNNDGYEEWFPNLYY